MAKAKKRRAKKRQSVRRTERVQATPETLAKLKPWPMQDLLRKGPENGGLSSNQFEAALQIVESMQGHHARLGLQALDLTRVGHGNGELGTRACRLWNIYVEWGNAYQRRALISPHVIVQMVEDERPIDAGAVWLVALAGDMWDEAKSQYDRAAKHSTKGTTSADENRSGAHIPLQVFRTDRRPSP